MRYAKVMSVHFFTYILTSPSAAEETGKSFIVTRPCSAFTTLVTLIVSTFWHTPVRAMISVYFRNEMTT